MNDFTPRKGRAQVNLARAQAAATVRSTKDNNVIFLRSGSEGSREKTKL